jgi:hypothetical protein
MSFAAPRDSVLRLDAEGRAPESKITPIIQSIFCSYQSDMNNLLSFLRSIASWHTLLLFRNESLPHEGGIGLRQYLM